MTPAWKCAVLFAILLTFAPSLCPALEPDLRSRVDELVEPLFQSEMTVGLVVGVIDSSGTLVAGYGTTSGRWGRVPDGKTIFEISSVTNVFTTLLLAEMAERGQLSLDDRAADYLPPTVTLPHAESSPEREITLLDLASHRSGLPRTAADLAPGDPANPYADYTVARLYDCVSSFVLPREPGSAYEFSSTGMALLGRILTLKTGKDFDRLVKEEITRPLGMKDTCVKLSWLRRFRQAQGHDADGVRVPNWDFPEVPAAGALHSTANDLLIFLAANLGLTETELSGAIRMTQEPVMVISTSGSSVAMGWHIQPGGVLWQNGQSGGYHAMIAFLREMGIGVVVLSNSAVMAVDRLGFTILKVMAGEEVEPLEFRVPVAVDPAVFARYVGVYDLPMGMSVEVRSKGDILLAQPKNQAAVRLYPESDTRFFLKAVDAEVEFVVDEELGEATHLIWTQAGREIAGKKITEDSSPPPTPNP